MLSQLRLPKAVIDAEGYAVCQCQCPDCGTRIKCGPTGLANLEKRHQETATCKAAQAKCEKAEKDLEKKKKGSILAFLKPRAATVASTIAKPAPIHSHKLPQSPTKPPWASSAIHANLQPEEELDEITIHRPITNNFVKHLWTLVNGLPESIPEGSKFDKLAYFACDPKDFDDPTVDADEKWG
jgi:hypothetical protein